MLNNGFNEDEDGKLVWDGMNPNIAGMMGSFNVRFTQPGDIAELYFPGADGPLWWADYEDKARGRPAWGLLTRCTQTNTCPNIMETYGGPEAWYSRGTVGIAGTKGTEDLPLPDIVRRYYHAGTTHGGGAGGFNLGTASTNPNQFAANPNPQREINRALYVAMVEWVTKGMPPPASRYPKVSDGTLVEATSAAMGWPNIPNSPKPDGVMNSVLDYDYGPQFRYNDGSGVITNVPPPIKQVIPTLAPKVDADGNEIAGIKSLLMRVPLGTYTAWNPIATGPLKGREASLSAGLCPVREDQGRAPRERRFAPVDRGALLEPVAVLLLRGQPGEHHGAGAVPAAGRRGGDDQPASQQHAVVQPAAESRRAWKACGSYRRRRRLPNKQRAAGSRGCATSRGQGRLAPWRRV